MAEAVGGCSEGVKARWYAVLEKVSAEYAEGVKQAVNKR